MAKSSKKKTKEKSKKPAGDLLSGILDEIGGEDGAQLLGSEGLAIKIRGIISTQSPSIDWATGRGGIPLGRLTILHGKEGCGKTTLALHIVAECQQQKGIVIYMDKEYKLDPDYARSIGVNTKRLLIIQPPHLERVFETTQRVIEKAKAHREATGKRTPILIVLDSMNAAITKAQFEGGYEDQHVAPEARVYSRLLPKLIPLVSQEDVALLWISQVRQKIGVKFGDPNDVCGGNSPKFYASMILHITNFGSEKEDGEKVANKLWVEPKKNQIAPPFKKAEVQVVYGKGLDKEKSLIWIAEKLGVVKKKGSYYNHNGERLGQGLKAAAQTLRVDEEWYEKILKEAKEKGGW